MAKKKPSISSAKEKAWDAFSLYIRTRDCKEYAKAHPESNTGPEAACVTCQRVYPLKSLQAGHFIAGRRNAQLFDEKGVNAQCYGCNIRKKGATDEYWLWMEKKYGREVIDELIAQKHVTLILKAWEYEAIEQTYKDKLKELV